MNFDMLITPEQIQGYYERDYDGENVWLGEI
jgi:hypothetical protein